MVSPSCSNLKWHEKDTTADGQNKVASAHPALRLPKLPLAASMACFIDGAQACLADSYSLRALSLMTSLHTRPLLSFQTKSRDALNTCTQG